MAKDNEKIETDMSPRVTMYAITVYYIYQECFKKINVIENGKFERQRSAIRLLARLKKEFPENKQVFAPSYGKYIRDRFSKACYNINKGKPYKWIGVAIHNFDPIRQYSGVENTEDVDCAFKIPPLAPKFIIEDLIGSDLKIDAIRKFLTPSSKIGSAAGPVRKPFDKESTNTVVNETLQARVPFVYTSKPYSRLNFFSRVAEDEGTISFFANGNCEFEGKENFTIKKADLISVDPHKMPNDSDGFWVKVKYMHNQQLREAYFAEPLPVPGPLKLAPQKNMLNWFTKQLQG